MSVHTTMAKRWLLTAMLVSLLSSCSVSGLAFARDSRVEILSPRESSVVPQHLTIRWRVHDLRLVPPGSKEPGVYFGVFLDRAPMPPGADPRSLVDALCRRANYNCITPDYFSSLKVYFTADHQLTLDVPPLSSHHSGRDVHFVNIVLMSKDRRIGEALYSTSFRVGGQ